MNRRLLLRRSLQFHLRAHLGVVLGAAIASAVLVGALVVGDSVRGTLRQRALQRLGGAVAALDSGDRFFRARPGGPAGAEAGVPATHALRLPGVVARQDGAARVGQATVFGVPTEFWNFHLQGGLGGPGDGEAFVNRALAARLGIAVGDSLVLRLHKPSALSRDAVIMPRDQQSVALRVRVGRILEASEAGNLSYAVAAGDPYNVFVSHDALARVTGLSGRANLALVGESSGPVPGPAPGSFEAAVREGFDLADVELDVRHRPLSARLAGGIAPPGSVDLVSGRIFLDPAALEAATRLPVGVPATPVLTYLVNALQAPGGSVPYSMVTAAGAPYTPSDLADDEILVNRWLADDLKVGPGDPLDLVYYRVDGGSQLTEYTNRFRVRAVVPMQGLHADRGLMPEFPGLSQAESTHDWDAGFELTRTIRDVDEAYWKAWRGTPKAFVSPAAGRRMWSNRFGEATAVRWFVPADGSGEALRGRIATELRKGLDPVRLGLRFEDVREPALKASRGGQDFGGLFIGFSFFLIFSAVLLTAMLFRFGVEQRASESGLLLALGWSPGRVLRLQVREGGALAAWGAMFGGALGLGYGWAVLWGLNTRWKEAVGGASLEFHATPASVAFGAFGAFLVAVLAQWWTVRAVAARPARELLGEGWVEPVAGEGRPSKAWPGWAAVGAGTVLATSGAFLPASVRPGAFFGAGFLLLVGLLREYRRRLGAEPMAAVATEGLGFRRLVSRAAGRRPGRSTGVVALLAVAVFLIVAVAANRLDARRDARERSSGTGGFALWASSTLPIVEDLDTRRGQEKSGLDPKRLAGFGVVPLRVRDGDEASCLNLSQAQRPRLLGVDPARLDSRGAFTFKALAKGADPTHPWRVLSQELAEDEVPAVGDANSLQWALKLGIGDSIEYTDERGKTFRVRIVGAVANSILQGQLLIPEAAFTRRFPSEPGHRIFLVDAEEPAAVSAELTRSLTDFGFEAEPAADRLNRFNAVQNTYLDTFQVLGGLGLLLGSVGLGVLVLRNLQERRAELAVLSALGFPGRRIGAWVLREHLGLLLAGTGLGTVAALVAVAPALLEPGAGFPWRGLLAILAAVVLNGVAWTWATVRRGTRTPPLEALRGE